MQESPVATAATVNNKKTTSPASQGHRKKMPAVIMVASKLEAIFYSSISDIGTKWKSSEFFFIWILFLFFSSSLLKKGIAAYDYL